MRLDIQYKIRENRIYLDYLHSHSYWYKYLNRSEEYFNDFVTDMKDKYGYTDEDITQIAAGIDETYSDIITFVWG